MLSRLVYPYLVRGAAGYQRMIASPPPGEDWACFVATESGQVVGRVSAFRGVRSADPGFGRVSLLHVHPAHRRRGLGTALFEAAAGHLRSVGVHRAATTTTVEALPFARRFGFEPTRELRYSALDLRPYTTAPATYTTAPATYTTAPATYTTAPATYTTAPATYTTAPATYTTAPATYTTAPATYTTAPATYTTAPATFGAAPTTLGVDAAGPTLSVVSLRDLDPRILYAADVSAATDEPGDAPPVAASYETWRYDVWDNIGLDRDASTALLDGTDVVSFSVLMRDGDRVWSDMTATVPSHRGRGLARQVKTAALYRAAASGALTAYTSNDESNAPMLAVNTHLGYRPIATQLSCVADL